MNKIIINNIMLTIMKLQPDTIVIEVVVIISKLKRNIYEKERNLKKC